jgi:hypothetical protein
MPQAGPLPAAAIMPDTKALPDLLPSPAAPFASMTGLGAFALPSDTTLSPDHTMRDVAEFTESAIRLQMEIMRSYGDVRGPSDLMDANTRVIGLVASFWMSFSPFAAVMPHRR